MKNSIPDNAIKANSLFIINTNFLVNNLLDTLKFILSAYLISDLTQQITRFQMKKSNIIS